MPEKKPNAENTGSEVFPAVTNVLPGSLIATCLTWGAKQRTTNKYIGPVIKSNSYQAVEGPKNTLTFEGAPSLVYSGAERVFRFRAKLKTMTRGQIRVDA